jgi:hypothetical protein
MTIHGGLFGNLIGDSARISLRRDGTTLRSLDVTIEETDRLHAFTLDHIFTPATSSTAFYSVFVEHLSGDLLFVQAINSQPLVMELRDVGAV